MPKNERGPFGLVRFWRLRKKVKNERGSLCTKFTLAGLGLSSFSSFCKKWYIHDEVCGLTKKKQDGNVQSRAISDSQKSAVFKPVKAGPFGCFENPVCCKISNKLNGGPFGDQKTSEFF